jgi:hypothetical protein
VHPRRSIVLLGVPLAVLALLGGAARADRLTGSGRVVDQTRTVGDFTRIEVGSGIQVRVEAGARSALALRGEDNVLPHVITEVRGKTLHIGMEPNLSLRTSEAVQVSLRAPRLDGLTASGGSRLEATTPSGDTLELAASGGARLHLGAPVKAARLEIAASGGATLGADSVAAGSVQLTASGAAVVDLAGTAQELTLRYGGGAEIHGAELAVGALDVEGGGGAVATLRVSGPVRGSLGGGARLNVSSDASVEVKTSGGAQVRKRL